MVDVIAYYNSQLYFVAKHVMISFKIFQDIQQELMFRTLPMYEYTQRCSIRIYI